MATETLPIVENIRQAGESCTGLRWRYITRHGAKTSSVSDTPNPTAPRAREATPISTLRLARFGMPLRLTLGITCGAKRRQVHLVVRRLSQVATQCAGPRSPHQRPQHHVRT